MAQQMGLEEALDIAMDAELRAQAFYAQAAIQVLDPKGRDLLSRLASFEQYHYRKLAELAQSLEEGEGFIGYEAQSMAGVEPFQGSGEAAGTQVAEMQDEAAILTAAIDNERTASERYRALAEQTKDADGKAMFNRLAYEEEMHQRILEDEFYALSNQGTWAWSGLYGE
ncbi:MAG: ferritin family protein [Anaerolineae bacterium]|jgi:rubrerythrin